MDKYIVTLGWTEDQIRDTLRGTGQAGTPEQVAAIAGALNQSIANHGVREGMLKQAIRDVGVIRLSHMAPPILKVN